MQDPSVGVQPPLDKHVHLISGYQFPLIAQVGLEQAFRYLLEAPSVVKLHAPMSWQYVSAPQDGTLWLEWLSPGQNGGRFPSDGYAWGDPEQSFRQNVNGYTVELLMHQSGFRPGLDHMTAHARTRYHLIAKAPHVNAAAPDPSLWIVHYHHAPQERILPTAQVSIDQTARHIMQERAWLERQGRIERRDFMLHDREHWPTITLPSAQHQQMQQPGSYPPGVMQNQTMNAQARYNNTPFPQPQGPPSAKRQRLQGPGMLSGPQEVGGGQDVEDEEYTALGDYFDHLTPREISLTRYQQHHVWMEEVFQSPYAMRNIIPVDLGLGLMGELKGLTEGILPPPKIDELLDKPSSKSSDSTETNAFTNIPKEQLEEFNSRVQKHIDEGTAEIERMKANHAAKMREWRKTHKLTQAESQLRGATWKGHESALSRPVNESTTAQPARVEDVIDSVEQLVGLKIKTHTDATLIEKGGLQRVERPALDGNASLEQSKAPSAAASGGVASTGRKAEPTTAGHASTSNDVRDVANQDNGGDGLDMLNDSMDIDAADLGFDVDEQNTSPQAATAGNTNESDSQTTNTMQTDLEKRAADTTSVVPDTAKAQGGTTSMFNDSSFGFGNDGAADAGGEEGATGEDIGDGLIDFGDEDGMGMDDSAFGDALHGMDS